jgi:2-succinyl-5-enolpyruvyl-6-hydroxy-3-cyclohexene-1-carboxylate synthase
MRITTHIGFSPICFGATEAAELVMDEGVIARAAEAIRDLGTSLDSLNKSHSSKHSLVKTVSKVSPLRSSIFVANPLTVRDFPRTWCKFKRSTMLPFVV